MVLNISMRAPILLGVMLFVITIMGLVYDTEAAGPVYWDWPKVQPFAEMELDGTTVDSRGYLTAALAATSFSGNGPEVYWRAISDGSGGYFTGTGHSGEIYHTDKNGEVSKFAEIEGSEVFSLLLLEGNSLLAGCGPGGEIFRIDEQGEAKLIGSTSGGYAWAMIQDQLSQDVYIAAGSPAALYRLQGQDQLEMVWEFPAQNALDVVMAPDGGILVATQGPGCVYHVDAKLKNSSLLLEMNQDEARQFLYGPGDALYVIGFNGEDQDDSLRLGLPPGGESESASMLSMLLGDSGPQVPRSVLYRLSDDGIASLVWTSETELMIAAWDKKLGWMGGGELDDELGQSILYALDLPVGEHPLARWDGGDILDILVTGNGNSDADLIVCQAFPGSVTALGRRGDRPHVALSEPLDGGRPIRWGRLNWTGISGQGKLKWSVRGGNSSEPDESWTPWSDSWTSESHVLDIQPSRFLQWRVTFPSKADLDQSWALTRVSVSAWRDNQPPVISEFNLEQLVGVEAGGMMGGSDNVTQLFRSGLFAEFSRTADNAANANPALARIARPVHVFSWQAMDAEDDRLLFTLQYSKLGTEAWRDILVDYPDNIGSWDTSEVVDGLYEVRLMASDRRDNPHHMALASVRMLGPMKVDNTAPTLESLRFDLNPDGFRVRFIAVDESSDLAGAQIQLPDGTIERLDPKDGICDSLREEFDAVITWPRIGSPANFSSGTLLPWLVGIAVQDLGGNLATSEGEVR